MISKAKMFLMAAIAASYLPVAANAATVQAYDLFANNNYGDAVSIAPNQYYEFVFTVKEALKINKISVSGTGLGTPPDAQNDVANLSFGFAPDPTGGFTLIQTDGDTAAGIAFLNGGTFAANDVFTLYVNDGIIKPVQFTFSFQTAVIPLPATALLLAPVLAAGGVVAMRRRKAGQTEA